MQFSKLSLSPEQMRKRDSAILFTAMPTNQFTPLKAICMFNQDWRIKVRVVRKSQLRSWKNDKSEGWVLTVDLIDEQATLITASFFNASADAFNSKLQVG